MSADVTLLLLSSMMRTQPEVKRMWSKSSGFWCPDFKFLQEWMDDVSFTSLSPHVVPLNWGLTKGELQTIWGYVLWQGPAVQVFSVLIKGKSTCFKNNWPLARVDSPAVREGFSKAEGISTCFPLLLCIIKV